MDTLPLYLLGEIVERLLPSDALNLMLAWPRIGQKMDAVCGFWERKARRDFPSCRVIPERNHQWKQVYQSLCANETYIMYPSTVSRKPVSLVMGDARSSVSVNHHVDFVLDTNGDLYSVGPGSPKTLVNKGVKTLTRTIGTRTGRVTSVLFLTEGGTLYGKNVFGMPNTPFSLLAENVDEVFFLNRHTQYLSSGRNLCMKGSLPMFDRLEGITWLGYDQGLKYCTTQDGALHIGDTERISIPSEKIIQATTLDKVLILTESGNLYRWWDMGESPTRVCGIKATSIFRREFNTYFVGHDRIPPCTDFWNGTKPMNSIRLPSA